MNPKAVLFLSLVVMLTAAWVISGAIYDVTHQVKTEAPAEKPATGSANVAQVSTSAYSPVLITTIDAIRIQDDATGQRMRAHLPDDEIERIAEAVVRRIKAEEKKEQ